jgi:hypothetical protein
VGAVEAVMRVLHTHGADASAAQMACAALGGVCDHEGSCARAVALNAVAAVLAVLRRHPSHSEVQFSSFNAMDALVSSDSPARDADAVVQHVVASLRARGTHPDVQERCCSMLMKLAGDAQHAQRAVDAGAVELLVGLLKVGQTPLPTTCVVNNAAFALATVADNAPGAARAERAGVVDKALTVARAYARDADLQTGCCDVLFNVCRHNEAASAAALRGGAMAVAQAALRAHGAHDEDTETSAKALLEFLKLLQPSPPPSEAAGVAGSSGDAGGLLRRCSLPACGAAEPHRRAFKVCSRCRKHAYCCVAHQAEDWSRHKRDDACGRAPPAP